ncbi:phytoene/squalene synthase family protein [Zhengella mangrovi]|uniref:Phytoene/squalene synthase family protein n=2 Tax=Zhengella mangrovi TaxID=1982044 RepID=A0A2G1QSD2_9HYPH|nr:phytoene/squalene synthase family protein [Zhengella mangrovi]
MDAGAMLASLRSGDPDRYLSVLYAPADRRDALTALYAFNMEVARIRDAIREPLAGEIRLQWWRDALATPAAGADAGHPVAAAFARVIDDFDLPRASLEAYFEARLFDLYDDPMPSLNDLEGYCGETAGAILQMAATILDRPAVDGTGTPAGHAACAQAMTGQIRLMPLHRARGQCYVPAELLAACGLDREAYLGDPDPKRAGALVAALAAKVREHLRMWQETSGQVAPSLRPAYLVMAPVPSYLAVIERTGADCLERTPEISAIRRYWRFLRAAMG